MLQYQAIFFNKETMESLIAKQDEKLTNNILNMHVTFKYMPTEEEIENFSKIVGKVINLKVIGYGSNGKNSGFEVELPKEIEQLYTNSHVVYENGLPQIKRTTPHITVSLNEGAKAVDTGKLDFKPLERPFEISGIAGFYEINKDIGKGKIVYEKKDKEKIENKNKANNDLRDINF